MAHIGDWLEEHWDSAEHSVGGDFRWFGEHAEHILHIGDDVQPVVAREHVIGVGDPYADHASPGTLAGYR